MLVRLLVGAALVGSLLSSAEDAAASPDGRGAVASPASVPGLPGAVEPYTVAGAHQFAMRSRAGLDYRIFIYQPSAPPPPSGYPVIYVLDGNAWFDPVMHAIRLQASRPQMGGAVPAVVVGVGYPSHAALNQPRRFFDFVPAAASRADMRPEHQANRTGGAAEFRDFLVNELAPVVEKQVPIDHGRRILFGHSLGCSFALHVLFTAPRTFPNYVCSSPSLGFGGGYLLDAEKAFRATVGDARLDVRLLLAAAEFDEKVPPGLAPGNRKQFEAIIRRAQVVSGLKALHGRLQPLSAKGLTTDLRVIERENHLSVVPVVVNRMLELMLRPDDADRQAAARP